MIDNFEQIGKLLTFDNNNEFYFVQVIQRKKDHKESNKRLGRNNNARLIKAYYIYSKEQLEEYKEEMIKLSEIFNARIGINLNKRHNRKVALEMMEQLAHCIKSENYFVSRLYNSCCGMVHSKDKLWILDVDGEIPLTLDYMINSIQPMGDKIVAKIPTRNGIHYITKPFNSMEFKKHFPQIEIHKNNPTVLYIP